MTGKTQFTIIERLPFDCVLAGDHHGVGVGGQVSGGKGVMVGKPGSARASALLAQRVEKALRVANAGQRHHRPGKSAGAQRPAGWLSW